jgi:hypothetical protein
MRLSAIFASAKTGRHLLTLSSSLDRSGPERERKQQFAALIELCHVECGKN